MSRYELLISDIVNDINLAENLAVLQEVKVKYTGRKGVLTELNKAIPTLPVDDRKDAGASLKTVRLEFQKTHDIKEAELKLKAREEKLSSEVIDVTMPAVSIPVGSLHPIYQVYDELVNIFASMGYEVVTGPEVELDYYNFEALNMPANHPARDMQDTFYISDKSVLRTHTSPVQVRTMLKNELPIKVVAPGKTYRSDHDMTHSPMFHQIEGLYIDKNVTLGDLKGTLTHFIHKIFGENITVRFRSSFFPFTEPSMEVDMACVNCGGSGCRVCKNTGWLEVGGCGMVAPEVLKAVNIDDNIYSGFAFGMGIERITMLKYGIDDLRLFFENRIKFVKQF